MRIRAWLFACSLALALVLPGVARAQLAQSLFTTDAEGWVNVMLPYPSAVPPTIYNTYAPTWEAGHLRFPDPDGSGSFGNAQYWQAPAAFLGNKLAAVGGTLAFDVANVGSGFGPFTQEDLVLVGGGLTLVRALPSQPGSTFAHYALPMVASAWHVNALNGPAPTATEFDAVLGALEQMFIRAEYQLGPDTQYLDDVVLSGPSTGAGMPATRVELAPPSPNPSARTTRVEFALPRAGAVDLAVYDAAGRRVATLASGEHAAGPHSAAWAGLDAGGRGARAGLYWVRLSFDGQTRVRKLVRVE